MNAMAVSTTFGQLCPSQWLPGLGFPGINGAVYASTFWDPDGPGPLPKQLVVGGEFSIAGGASASGVARWTGTEWVAFGSGVSGPSGIRAVRALATLPNGELVVGGNFSLASGSLARCIARWTGEQWVAIGSGMLSSFDGYVPSVEALTVLANGDLVAGGYFTSAGGVTARNVARWDGTAWHAQGTADLGNSSGAVAALAVLPGGDLVAGGNFREIGGKPIGGIARWDGTDWSAMQFSANSSVSCLHLRPDGTLLAGGSFVVSGNPTSFGIAVWNGDSWSGLGRGTGLNTRTITTLPDGSIAAASGAYAMRWNGTEWVAIGATLGPTASIYTLAISPGGEIVAAGDIARSRGDSVDSIARLAGDQWLPIGAGFNGRVRQLKVLEDHSLIAGGDFTNAGDVAANRIARWDGLAWSALGGGMGSQGNYVTAIAPTGGSGLVAGGSFLRAGQANTSNVALWNGTEWLSMRGGVNESVGAVGTLASGGTLVFGSFNSAGGVSAPGAARWLDGNFETPWNPGANGPISVCLPLEGGSFVIGGTFQTVQNLSIRGIARWNGLQWEALGQGFTSAVRALARAANGDIIAGGSFAGTGAIPARRVARWNGSQWLTLGTGTDGVVNAVAVMPNGDVIAAGNFRNAGNVLANSIARWNGIEWSAMGLGTNGIVDSLEVLPNGELAVGGQFTTVDGFPSPYFARWSPASRPVISRQPNGGTSIAGEDVVVVAGAAPGYSNTLFQWKRNGVDIHDGPAGSSPFGGNVEGASGELQSTSASGVVTLMIRGARHSDAGLYTLSLSGPCGESISAPADIAVRAHAADLNADGLVDDADFSLFLVEYDALVCPAVPVDGSCEADFNADRLVDDSDFTVFIGAYNAMIL